MKRGQLAIPNFLMVAATIIIFFLYMPTILNQVSNGLASTNPASPQYIIANSIPGIMSLYMLVGIIIYALIKYA